MGIFSTILNKLGLGDDKKEEVAQGATVTPGAAPPSSSAPSSSTSAPPAAASRPAPGAVSQVDVMAKLDTLARSNPEKLNWKTSIVDLMKLLGLNSSLASRKDLAAELGYPESKMDDSAHMNMWLHKTVLQKLAANGGNIPAELLD